MNKQVYRSMGISAPDKATNEDLLDVLSAALSYMYPNRDALEELNRILFSGRNSDYVQTHAPRFLNLFGQGFFSTKKPTDKIRYLEAFIDLSNGLQEERKIANSPVDLTHMLLCVVFNAWAEAFLLDTEHKTVDQLLDSEVLLVAAAKRIREELRGSIQIGYLNMYQKEAV